MKQKCLFRARTLKDGTEITGYVIGEGVFSYMIKKEDWEYNVNFNGENEETITFPCTRIIGASIKKID